MKKVLVAASIILLSRIATAQVQDTTPPALVAFSLRPASVDVSASSQTVTVTIRVTDDLSGYQRGFFSLSSPSGRQTLFGTIYPPPVSGDALDGTYQADVVVPQFSEAGTWHFETLRLDDLANNTIVMREADLQALGFPTELTVTGGPDLVPPALVDLTIAPAVIDVRQSSQSVTVTIHVTDALSGYQRGFFSLSSPSGRQTLFGSIYPPPFSGDSHDGGYQAQVVFPQFSEAGTWALQQLRLDDVANNTVNLLASDLALLGFSTTVDVTSISDNTPPALVAMSLNPSVIDVSGAPQTVTLTVRVTDDVSGFQRGFYSITSPSGRQTLFGAIYPPPVSGDAHDGVYQTQTLFPQFSEAGTWRVENLRLDDLANNTIVLFGPDLDALGFSRAVVVGTAPPTPAEAVTNLITALGNMSLPPNVAHSLQAPLGQASAILTDANPKNDVAACGKLDAFINEMKAKDLSPSDAAQLLQSAEAIKSSLGCP